jgi:DNA-binding transcriptional regulator YhcF (GntR family)
MNPSDFFQDIHLKENSVTPKYLQVANSIIDSIKKGTIPPAQLLPSINELNCNLDISRGTAERCYKYLRATGVLHSVPGRGFYTREQKTKERLKILLILNKLSGQKTILYNAFVSAINDCADLEVRVFNNDALVFERLLRGERSYDYYVIIPHFKTGHHKAYEMINRIPKYRLLILERLTQSIDGLYSSIVENHEQNIAKVLKQALARLKKYHTLKILIPKDDVFPDEIFNGLRVFCISHGFNFGIVVDLFQENITEGTVYIDLLEEDLVALVEKISRSGLIIGKHVGLISYNDSPLKRFFANGITTITVDFKMMGNMAAKIIREKSNHHWEVPYLLTLRNSL